MKLVVANNALAGTYRVTVYSKTNNAATSTAPVTFTVTVTAASTTLAGVNSYLTNDTTAGYDARLRFATPSDSAVSVSAGTAGVAPADKAFIFVTGKNAAGETTTAGGLNICTSGCSIDAIVTAGPAMVKAAGGSYAKYATISTNNSITLSSTETLTVGTDGSGSGGTATIKLYVSGTTTLLATKTITFYSATSASAVLTATDTGAITSIGAGGPHFTAVVKDANGIAITAGTIYVYSSDTSVISDSATACTAVAGVFSCSLTAVDTGTAKIVVRNTQTQSTSTTWVSDPITVTVTSNVIASFTASFDKSVYAPGEKAVLTITAKDRAGRLMDGRTVSSAFVITQNQALNTANVSDPVKYAGTAENFAPYYETGVETRVVYMPTVGGTFTYTLAAGTGSTIGTGATAAKAATVALTATITDGTKDAADAATDAALEATDAAYAAQDAAQLAAESADAATAAAEAATAAAEAATAAVEDLATKVAGLFADLQKQITTLANVVAKIAKKVKA